HRGRAGLIRRAREKYCRQPLLYLVSPPLQREISRLYQPTSTWDSMVTRPTQPLYPRESPPSTPPHPTALRKSSVILCDWQLLSCTDGSRHTRHVHRLHVRRADYRGGQ